jgi:uncharacterized membrane protein
MSVRDFKILPLTGEVARRAGGGSDSHRRPTAPSVGFADTSPSGGRI